jgi:hypothetical protein
MVYGCGCGVIVRFNLLIASLNIRLFWLSLSKLKWRGVPFTHIYELKRRSPSLVSSGSFGWNFLVVMVTLGSTSMIWFPLSNSKSEYNLSFESEASISTNNYRLE